MGLSWINPLYFSGLLLLALPVLIHLMQRRHPTGFRFPSLMFLERIPWREKRRFEIRNWLLLLLRCLILLLLVTAFARPLVDSGETAAPDADRIDSMIVLDRSYSMRIDERWGEALDIARQLIADKGPRDRIGIIVFDASAEVVSEPVEDAAELRRTVSRLQPGLGATRMRTAIEQADRLLDASSAGQRRILLISDFQAGAAEIPVIDRDIEIETFAVASVRSENVALGALTIESASAIADDQFAVSVEVANHAPAALARQVRLELNGRQIATRQLRLEVGETRVVEFDDIAAGAGLLRGTVSLGEDALEVDNRAHFVYSSRQKIPVLIVEAENTRDDRSLYLEQAMALSRQPLFRVERASWSDLAPGNLAAWAVIIVNDAALPGGALGDALTEFVAAGGGLLVALGDAAQGNWQAADDGPLPGKLARRIDAASGSAARFAALVASHPLASIDGDDIDLATARVFSYRDLQARSGDRVLARFVDGDIALLEREFGDGRTLVLSTTLDPRWNDLVLQPVFVPFLHHALRYLARFEPYPQDFRIGDIVDLLRYARATAGADALVAAGGSADLVVEAPSGGEIRLPRSGALLDIDQQGFYQLHRATPEGIDVVIAANVDSSESIPLTLDAERLVEDIRASSRPAAPLEQLTRRRAAELEQRQQLWHLLLAAMLGALLLEAFYANWISVKRSRRTAV